MTPEYAEAMLTVLNNNAEQMARHIATGQTVTLQQLPDPRDYQAGNGLAEQVNDLRERVERLETAVGPEL